MADGGCSLAVCVYETFLKACVVSANPPVGLLFLFSHWVLVMLCFVVASMFLEQHLNGDASQSACSHWLLQQLQSDQES